MFVYLSLLLYLKMYVCKTRIKGKVIVSAPIQDRRLKLLVNIPIIIEHNQILRGGRSAIRQPVKIFIYFPISLVFLVGFSYFFIMVSNKSSVFLSTGLSQADSHHTKY